MEPSGGSGFLCGSSSFHPYECDGIGKCVHCDRELTPEHDPGTCALCDPSYDYAPNDYWGKPALASELEDWEMSR